MSLVSKAAVKEKWEREELLQRMLGGGGGTAIEKKELGSEIVKKRRKGNVSKEDRVLGYTGTAKKIRFMYSQK